MLRIRTDLDKKMMAEAYLMWGTIRLAALHTGWSKSTVHCTIQEFIQNGEFRDTYALVELIEKNKKEAPARGGKASALKCKVAKKLT